MKEAGFALYGFKAVKTANGGAAPVVWFQTLAQVLMQTTTVSWTEQYQAYVSTSQIIPNGSITASSAIDAALAKPPVSTSTAISPSTSRAPLRRSR